MQVIESIKSRRSIKKYQAKPISKEVALKLIEAASMAPTGANKQPWEFVLFTDKSKLAHLSKCHQYSAWLADAALGVALVGDPDRGKYWLEDCCCAAENLWLAATDMGLGVAWGAVFQNFDSTESEKRESFVREALGIPKKYRVIALLGLGYPADEPKTKELRKLEEIVHWEKF